MQECKNEISKKPHNLCGFCFPNGLTIFDKYCILLFVIIMEVSLMIEIQNICFERDNKKILDNVSLTINDGEFVAVTGPNGSGKSTLAKIIMGINKQDSGKIIFNGQDISDMSIVERANLGISFAFQQPVRFKGITVSDLIRLSSKGEVNRNQICDILSSVGLCAKEYMNREVNNSLSGGELKRIEIATILNRESNLIILDEPEAGIDLWSFNNLTTLFKEMRDKAKSPILTISHQERILNIADRIVILKDGKVDKIESKEQLSDDAFLAPTCCKLQGGEINE